MVGVQIGAGMIKIRVKIPSKTLKIDEPYNSYVLFGHILKYSTFYFRDTSPMFTPGPYTIVRKHDSLGVYQLMNK